jgi:hypothetical protein
MKYLPKLRNAIQQDRDWGPVEQFMNYEWMDGFVKAHVKALVDTYGLDRMEEVVENEIPDMEIISFIGYIIEVGGVLSLSKLSEWETLTVKQKNCLVEMTVVAMDTALAYHMMISAIYFSPADNYFGEETLRILIERIETHIATSETNGEGGSFTDYATNIYMQYLLPINGLSTLSWI